MKVQIPAIDDGSMIETIERVRSGSWCPLYTAFSENGDKVQMRGNCVGWIMVDHFPNGGAEAVIYSGKSVADALAKVKEFIQ